MAGELQGVVGLADPRLARRDDADERAVEVVVRRVVDALTVEPDGQLEPAASVELDPARPWPASAVDQHLASAPGHPIAFDAPHKVDGSANGGAVAGQSLRRSGSRCPTARWADAAHPGTTGLSSTAGPTPGTRRRA